MSNKEKIRQQAAKRAQRLRDRRAAQGITLYPLPLSTTEASQLNEICAFFSYPNKPCKNTEALQLMIHRVHAEMDQIKESLGACQYCGEQLPEGCAKLKSGGLFKGDARCWHTINRVRLSNFVNKTYE
ncbi:hypothetical protein IHC93_07385 [Photobacterium damselae subsp. damselae]|uniref:hypothetical protein n=1 Tax=Photobacterium damselae TaxID=38293 RepID=UPI001F25F2A3|nr:hypothetical protein [Photobacterium damselae]UKA26658.1 hypothetical protein IHC93_07385 [Photobacterium damselae subsp. damselae]